VTVFERYAPFYDLLYQDKDYSGEVEFVAQRLRDCGIASGRLLDLGCGTGVHAIEFARRGWDVVGVDLSEEMIAKARARASKEAAHAAFRQGDACESGPERDFDAVVSLFHVASYQPDRTKLEALLATAYAALRPDGIFLFDYWYGGAVLAQGVETRVKIVERRPLRVTRIAQPDHDEAAAKVQVNYTVFCEDMDQATIQRIDEVHRMRYWFPFEIEASLAACGFRPAGHYAWLSSDAPSSKVWAAYSIARKSAAP
jgi:SAM-dependent methyltransferase